jgi:hypothetical protein
VSRLWHGGVPGLAPGALVLPSAVTGVEPATLGRVAELGGDAETTRRDRVYVTSDRQVAAAYAALFPNGALYEVEPVGPVEPDPDCLVPGLSARCLSARVVRVADPVVLLSSRSPMRWLRMANGGPLEGGTGEMRARFPVPTWEAGKRR